MDTALEQYVPPYERFSRWSYSLVEKNELFVIPYLAVLAAGPLLLFVDVAFQYVLAREQLKEQYRVGGKRLKDDVTCSHIGEVFVVAYSVVLLLAGCFLLSVSSERLTSDESVLPIIEVIPEPPRILPEPIKHFA